MSEPIHLRGSVEFDFYAHGYSFDVAQLTEGWTDKEKQRLARGDQEARDELIAAAVRELRAGRVEVEAEIAASRIEDIATIIEAGARR